MLKDKSGSMTVESSLIVPMIIFLVITFVAIIIFSFNYNLEILKVHNKGLVNTKEVSLVVDFSLRGIDYNSVYNYKPSMLSTGVIQKIIALLYDLIDFYYQGLIHG